MSQGILEAKSALKALVDTFSNLADEKRIPDQMLLLTPDTKVQVYMGDELLVDISGTQQVAETFTAFTANVKRSFHMNGQQVVEIDGDFATGIAYCQVKLATDRGRDRDGDRRRAQVQLEHPEIPPARLFPPAQTIPAPRRRARRRGRAVRRVPRT